MDIIKQTVNKEECEECFKIICLRCRWSADNDDYQKIMVGDITACPDCGWKPGEVL